jgi:hypothetical protein
MINGLVTVREPKRQLRPRRGLEQPNRPCGGETRREVAWAGQRKDGSNKGEDKILVEAAGFLPASAMRKRRLGA